MRDANASIRAGAASTLGQIGAEAEEAVAALQQALKDPDDVVQKQAETALKKIGDAGQE